MKTIDVNIKQKNIKYNILFGDDIFVLLKKQIKDIGFKKILFVIDDNVFKIYKDQILSGLEELNAKYITIKHGEQNKNYKTVFKIVDKLIEEKITRKDYIIALGGGVTGDITGFACSMFKRGVNLVQIPTTLLSMLDSSVGGKTGVDYMGIKNIIGAFYSPNFVIINKRFLLTLPVKEVLSGFFEGVKHSILSGKENFFEFFTSYKLLFNQNNKLNKIIKKNIRYKLRVVKSDPFEKNGKRKILNYGHTFGHALETYLDFKLGHGICVGFGIIFTNILSHNKGYLKKENCDEINDLIKNILKDIKFEKLNFEKIYELMMNDKKNESAKVKFILLKDYSEVFEYDASKNDIKEAFDLFVNYKLG